MIQKKDIRDQVEFEFKIADNVNSHIQDIICRPSIPRLTNVYFGSDL